MRYRDYFYWQGGDYHMEIGKFLDDLFAKKKKDAAFERIETLKDLYV